MQISVENFTFNWYKKSFGSTRSCEIPMCSFMYIFLRIRQKDKNTNTQIQRCTKEVAWQHGFLWNSNWIPCSVQFYLTFNWQQHSHLIGILNSSHVWKRRKIQINKYMYFQIDFYSIVHCTELQSTSISCQNSILCLWFDVWLLYIVWISKY